MAKKSMSINNLVRQDAEEIFALNTSAQNNDKGRVTNVTFDVSYGNGQSRSVVIYESWIPQDLTAQADKASILASPSFRDAVQQGWITLVPNEDAERLLTDEEAQTELSRLRNRHRSVNSAMGTTAGIEKDGELPLDLAAEADAEGGNINPVFADMVVRDDLEANEVYSKLRNYEATMSLEEARYVEKNLHGKGRNEKVTKLLQKIIANKS